MEIREEPKSKIVCDFCKKGISKQHYSDKNHKCVRCGRDTCCYCGYKLIESYRRNPDCGYTLTARVFGIICKKCSLK